LTVSLERQAEDTPRYLRGRGLCSALTEDNPTAIWAYNLLRTKHFQEVSAGNQHPYVLTSRYGKVHIPTDLVVAQEASAVESSSRLDFLLLHNLGMSFIAP
jgi:hypothetical protein